MSERRGYRVEDRRRVIPLEYRVNRHTSINPNTWSHKRENTPSMINDRPETKAWNIFKNFAPTGGNVGRHVGNYLSDIFGIGSLANKASFYSGGSPGPKERKKLQPKERSNQEPLKGYYGWENVIPRDLRYDSQLPHQYQYIDRPLSGPGRTIVSDEAPPWQYKNTRTSDWYDQHSSPLTPEWQWSEGITNTGRDSNIFNDYLNYTDSGFNFNDYSNVLTTPDMQGGWLDNNPWFLSLMSGRHGGPETKKYLEGMGVGGDGFSAFGANWTPNFERSDDGWTAGLTGEWNLQDLFGEN